MRSQFPDEEFQTQTDFDDGVVYYAGPYETKQEANEKKLDLQNKGFETEIKRVPSDEEIAKDGFNEEVTYNKEGIYYRILVGKFADAVPGEYATLLIQAENLFDTEQDVEGNTYMYSTKIESFDEVKDRVVEFGDLGIEDMEIVYYYKYDPIPKEQAEGILNDNPPKDLTPYEIPTGENADKYLYQKDAVYFRVMVGRFDQEVPADFANTLLVNGDENLEQEETLDGEIIFYSESRRSFEEIEADKTRLVGKGFVNSEIVAFHKYDEISVDKAKNILAQ